jgi:hypothetical protein
MRGGRRETNPGIRFAPSGLRSLSGNAVFSARPAEAGTRLKPHIVAEELDPRLRGGSGNRKFGQRVSGLAEGVTSCAFAIEQQTPLRYSPYGLRRYPLV